MKTTSTKLQKIILVAGPTAAGKSEYAQKLALSQNGEIINADSQQFYCGLNIGTGKLLAHEQKVPHHLLDLLQPGEIMNAAEFVRQAENVFEKLFQQNKIPIVVGGTGLYLRALVEGFDDLPPRNDKIRECLQNVFKQEGGEGLHAKLTKIDPSSAAKISPQDGIRLVRYLEIYELTKKAPSSLMKRLDRKELRYIVDSYWLQVEREVLRERIANRVKQMLEAGWLQEVEDLIKFKKDPRDWSHKPIGYRELAEVVCGELEMELATAQIIQKTQSYAKRQDTFFRGLFRNSAYEQGKSSLQIIESV